MAIPNIPMVNKANLYVDGVELSFLDTTHVLVGFGQVRDSTDTNDILLSPTITPAAAAATGNPLNLVIDANAPFYTISVRNHGAVGGLDTGVLAPNLFYAVYVIADSKAGDFTSNNYVPPGVIISAGLTAPAAMPANYDMYRRIGFIRTDGTAAPNTLVLAFAQNGQDQSRTMWYDIPISVLVAGASAAYVNVPLGVAVPAIATDVTFDFGYTPTAPGNLANIRRTPAANPDNVGNVKITGTVAAVLQEEQVTCPCSLLAGVPNISYKNVGTLSLSVQNYVDKL